MPSDYQKQIKEIFGTADLNELRELAKMLKINNPNPRNAGRKAQLTPDQIVEILARLTWMNCESLQRC